MKRRLLYGSFLLITIFLISFRITPAPAGDRLLTVLNPAISSKMVERVPLTERTGTLEGRTIYMIDLQWGGPEAAYSVYEEMQAWFSRNMPAVKTEIRRSSGGPFGDDAALRKEIVEKKAGGAIIGIGG